MQSWEPWHLVPQSPQWSGSVWKLTHATMPFPPELQESGNGSAHPPLEAAQVPLRHISFDAHWVLQVPQKPGFVFVSTQFPLHVVSPGRQSHLPLRHAWSLLHWVPQVPQFRGSFCRSRQVPLHVVRPVAHWHCPPEQPVSSVGLHALPQLPQLLMSVCVFTHVPLHDRSPAVVH
jgi:hypothetical protein